MSSRKWYQGSILQDRHLEEFKSPEGSLDQAGIVISHSCDLSHGDMSNEPYAEILVGEFVPALDGNLTQGKHPRKLHVQMHGPGQNVQPIEFVPWQRLDMKGQVCSWLVLEMLG